MRWCLLSFVVAGCLPTIDVSPPLVCDVGDAGISTPGGAAVLIDRPLTVIASRRAPACPPSLDVTLQATVADPSAFPVPFTLAGPFARGQFVSAEVTFTPTRPGLHRVEVTFDPTLGRAANEVLAVEPMRLGTRVGSVDSSVRCQAEDVTPKGAWVCLEAGASQVSVWRAGMQLQSFTAVGFARVDEVVWLFGRGSVERFVDLGGDVLVREPDTLLKLDADLAEGELVAVDRDAVLVVNEGAVHLHTRVGQGLERAPPVLLPRGLCLGSSRVMPVSRTELALSCGSRPDWLRFCRVPLDATAMTRCREVPGRLAGASIDGLWLANAQTLTFTTLEGDTSLTLPAGWSIASSRRLAQAFSPLVIDAPGRAFLPRVTSQAIVLSAPPEGLSLQAFGSQRVLFEGLDGRLATTP